LAFAWDMKTTLIAKKVDAVVVTVKPGYFKAFSFFRVV